ITLGVAVVRMKMVVLRNGCNRHEESARESMSCSNRSRFRESEIHLSPQ
ncbi:hypothetical protein NPIL_16591, partial [Nephila pilipes]